MKAVRVSKSGWNRFALFCGPFWYIKRGMYAKGGVMLLLSLCTLGIGIIPVWIYCGRKGNSDFYLLLKDKQVYIH